MAASRVQSIRQLLFSLRSYFYVFHDKNYCGENEDIRVSPYPSGDPTIKQDVDENDQKETFPRLIMSCCIGQEMY